MSFEDALGLVLAVLVLGYLLFALISPEKLG
jgi:K+-transporting ATPase KdpF subunit